MNIEHKRNVSAASLHQRLLNEARRIGVSHDNGSSGSHRHQCSGGNVGIAASAFNLHDRQAACAQMFNVCFFVLRPPLG